MIQKILVFLTVWTFSSFNIALLVGRQLSKQQGAQPVLKYEPAPALVRVPTGRYSSAVNARRVSIN
jgi:hypothetical protein